MEESNVNTNILHPDNVNWEGIIANASDSDVAVSKWTAIFSLILDKHAPSLTRRVSDKYTSWLNSEFFRLAKTRNKLKIQAVKSKSTFFDGLL